MTEVELAALMRATGTEGYPSDVIRLVEAAQAAERERCAKLCDSLVDPKARYGEAEYSAGAEECARLIRG